MRCLLINNSPQPDRKDLAKLGGGGKSLLGLLSRLVDFGWEPQVVVPGEGQFTSELAEMNIPHTIYPFTPLSLSDPLASARGTVTWLRLLGKFRPALIHANGFELSRSFSLAAGLRRVPYITHVRFPVDPEGARWTLRGLPKPAAFIFNSHAMQKKLWPALGNLAPQAAAYVAHNAVDLTEFIPAPWPEGSTMRIGMVANFAPFKRHEDFLLMAAEMLQQRKDLEFWIVGEDTQGTGRREALRKLAAELNISSYVHFLGHRMDIPDILHQLHLLVVPSQFEPFGRVIIEAMASGRPVIGSNDGGIPEIIESGKNGLLVEVGNHGGFAKAALMLLNSRGKWESMAQNAVESVAERFSLLAHTRTITEIYQQVLADGS